MSGTGASLRYVEHGSATLATILNLVPTPSASWNDTALSVTLPSAGTYQLDASVRCGLLVGSPSEAFIRARLFDVTAGVVLPDSTVMVLQLSPPDSAANGNSRGNATAPIQVEYTVTQPTVIRLQGSRTLTNGTAANATIASNADGLTTLRYRRIA
ncbi:hypothetical protein PV410_12870 [Streptomyces sp. PA03-5A]|nr:hypothetical protein [Streptomyces sp. PA03-5A]